MKTLLRRTTFLVLSALCVLVLLTSGILRTVDGLVGTPKSFADTVIATATARGVEKSLADSVVTNISKNASPSVRVVIDQKRPQMESAIIRAMNEEANQAIVRQYLERFYNAFTSDHGGKINIRPAVERFISVLHQVDPSVPTMPIKLKHSVVRVKAVKWAGNLSRSIGTAAWFGILLGLALAIVAARFLIRRPSRRPWAVGITIGVPALLLFGLADATRSRSGTVHLANSTARILVRHTIYRVDSGLTDSALILFVADVLIVGGWLFFARLSRRRAAPTLPNAPVL